MVVDTSIFLKPYDAVYIEIPKVACSSMKVVFAQLLNISLQEANGNPHQVQFPSPQPAEKNSQGSLYPGFFTFAFVRNPWDRLLSCYQDKIRGQVDDFTNFTIRPGVANCLARFDLFVADMSFEDFVMAVASISDTDADEHFKSQYNFVTNEDGDIGIDYVGRFENLQKDFDSVSEKIGLPKINLPRLQAGRETVNYEDFYTDTTRKMVAQRFYKDIELFGYEY